MPYARQRGNQLAIVHGGRHPDTGKVEQQILFTLYSKAEAREAIGLGNRGGGVRFRDLLERQYPALRFNWKKIEAVIAEKMDVLPDLYEYKAERLHRQFRRDLLALTKQLILADPQHLFSSASLIREHRVELDFVAELIQWRLRLCEQKRSEWNDDNPFYWRFSMQGAEVPPEAEELAAGYYERGEDEKAAAVFRVLIECFADYAEGYNYLGLIAHRRHDLETAARHFQETIEVGRRLFPRRIARSRYWSDLSTRPYIRGLRNLAMVFNELGRYDDALALCDRLESECDDGISATAYRASVYLNIGRWQNAADAATRLRRMWPSKSFTAAFALFELGQLQDAAAMFLHAALNYPRAARMLLGMRTRELKDYEEARDHNVGVDERRCLHAYLAEQSRRAQRFFRGFIRHPQTEALLNEIVEVVARWKTQHRTGEREAFDRMQLMHTPELARTEATAIIEDMNGTSDRPAAH